MASVRSGAWLTVDTRQIKGFATALRLAETPTYTRLRVALREAGNIVADDARARSSWSTRIPGSIRVRATAASVSVIAGGHAAPNAAPLEHRGMPGTFRHPVFGHEATWATQQARPFLAPALSANIERTTVMVMDAIDSAVREVL